MEIIPVYIKKEIDTHDDISALIVSSKEIVDGDIIIIAQKIISKQEGRVVNLSTITPSLLAKGIASEYKKDSRIVELILNESNKIIRMKKGVIIVETKSGFICANAGIDESNVELGFATLLPVDSDDSAEKIRFDLLKKINKTVGVIISDTFGRPFRLGQTNVAIGISGMCPILNYTGTLDSFDRILRVTSIAVADEMCSTAELEMKKTAHCPIVIVRGFNFLNGSSSIAGLLRPKNEDLFR